MELYNIKMFKFIKQIFISALMFFGSLSNLNPLEFVSMKNQECKDLKLLILAVILYFTLLVLKQINVVTVVIILMIHMQEFMFLI